MDRDDAPAPPEEPAEHLRFAAYLGRLERVADADEADLISEVLADPDQAMARSAVVRHLDRRAGELYPGPGYEGWAASVAAATVRSPFLTGRLAEWSLFRAVALGLPWRREALLDASDWLQLRAAEAGNGDAVRILAECGRTRRIRNTARANGR